MLRVWVTEWDLRDLWTHKVYEHLWGQVVHKNNRLLLSQPFESLATTSSRLRLGTGDEGIGMSIGITVCIRPHNTEPIVRLSAHNWCHRRLTMVDNTEANVKDLICKFVVRLSTTFINTTLYSVSLLCQTSGQSITTRLNTCILILLSIIDPIRKLWRHWLPESVPTLTTIANQ